jgi:hypothetical protein
MKTLRATCIKQVRGHWQGLGVATSLKSCGKPTVDGEWYCEFHQKCEQRAFAKRTKEREVLASQGWVRDPNTKILRKL